MRAFLVFIVFVGSTGIYFWQKQHTPAPAIAESKPAAVTQSTSSAPQNAAPATPREPSEHNWMKRSLDRATAVRDQARSQTRAAQDP